MFVTSMSPVNEWDVDEMRCDDRVGGLGLFAGRTRMQSTMKKLISIFTLSYCILGVAGNLNPRLGKCCPYAEVISMSENFSCSFVYDDSPVIYQFQGHAGCGVPESENLTLTLSEDVVESTIEANIACIDILYADESNEAVPIQSPCGMEQGLLRVENFGAPRLPTLRMCCGIFEMYDVRKRDCVFNEDGYNVPDNFKFLNESLEFVAVFRGAPTCKFAIVDYVVDPTRDIRVLDDRKLEVVLHTKDGPETIIAHQNNTCLDTGTSETSGFVVIRACSEEKFCDRNPCVRKCCPENQAMINYVCDLIPRDLPPGYFHSILHNVSVQRGLEMNVDALESSDYGMLIGMLCEVAKRPSERYAGWHITRLGYLYWPHYKINGHDGYCMEMFFGDARLKDIIYPIMCLDSTEPVDGWAKRPVVIRSLKLISCFCLVVTLLVYICLPVIRNLHGKVVMCHVASLIVAFASIAYVELVLPYSAAVKYGVSYPDGLPFPTTIVPFIGYIIMISWMAAFTWLNVMCFDIWWTFGGLGDVTTPGDRDRADKKRFVMYSLYAWGLPLSIVCMAFTADSPELLFVVGTGSWLYSTPLHYKELIFFIGPIFIQLIANVIFFVLTARYCSRIKAEITRVMASPTDPRSQRYKAARTKYIMNIKLFVVMDVGWVFTMIQFLLVRYDVGASWRAQFFYVLTVYNDLRGVLIFILFVLKRKIYYDLLRRLGRGTISNTARLPDPYGENQREQQHVHIELASQHRS